MSDSTRPQIKAADAKASGNQMGTIKGVSLEDFCVIENPPRDNEVRQELDRIVRSAIFRDSLRLTRFITFVVEATLAGKGDRIKAYTIAVEALGRDGDFDPQSNPIVRVEAGRLRSALRRYYAGTGRDDPLVIELPRGTYVPTFHRSGAERPKPPPAVRGDPEPLYASDGLAELAEQYRELDAAWVAFQRWVETQRLHIDAVAADINGARQTLISSLAMLQLAHNSGFAFRPAALSLPTAPPSQSDAPRTADGSRAPSLPSDSDPGVPTAFRMLDEFRARLLAAHDLKNAVETILDAGIRLHRSDFGTFQLLDERTGQLAICAQRGFGESFLKTFERVSADDSCACGRALRGRASVIVEDVRRDPGFAAVRGVVAEAGYRAVQSTPLITSSGRLVGVVSTHFVRPHAPSRLDMLMTQFFARLAAEVIARLVPPAPGGPADRSHHAAA